MPYFLDHYTLDRATFGSVIIVLKFDMETKADWEEWLISEAHRKTPAGYF